MRKVLTLSIATLLVFLFVVNMANAQDNGRLKKVLVDKEFTVDNNATLKIDHEFGSINCINWDKNIIAIVATASVKSKNDEKAQKVLDRIKVDAVGNSSEVSVSCSLNQRGVNDKSQINIDLDIKIPVGVNIKIDQQFGNVYIERISGSSDISVDYGHIEIESLDGIDNKIDVSFGNMHIETANEADIEIDYGDCSIDEIQVASIESSYSKINIDKVIKLVLENDGGNVKIDNVEIVSLESNFAKIDINYLGQSISAETDYGNLTINNVSVNFSDIDIENEYCTVTIIIPELANYNFDLKGEYSDINIPEENVEITYRKKDLEDIILRGTAGKNNPEAVVNVSAEYGAIKIKNQ